MANYMRFIGDTHGKSIILEDMMRFAPDERSIHVGDFGVGFPKKGDEKLRNVLNTVNGDHKFIRGNHDCLFKLKHHFKDHWITDGHYDETLDMMFIGGAWSIDWMYRTPGKDWWHDEQIHEKFFDKIIKRYCEIKPKFVVTHDLPASVSYEMFGGHYRTMYENNTNFCLEKMFKAHQPALWCAGHWHDKRNWNIGSTNFIVVPMDKCVDIDLDNY